MSGHDVKVLAKPGSKKTPEGQDWVKRNLDKVVSDGSDSQAGAIAPPRDFQGEFDKMKRDWPYKILPAKLQSSLAALVEQALASEDEPAKVKALATFKRGAEAAYNAKGRWDMTSSSADVSERSIKRLETWNSPAAGALRGRMTTVNAMAAEWAFTEARKKLDELADDVNAAMKTHYEAERKTLEALETGAKSLGKDTFDTKILRDAYLKSAKVVDDAAARADFTTAIDKLPNLKKAAADAATAAAKEAAAAAAAAAAKAEARKIDVNAAFAKMKTESPFKDFPAKLQTSLAAPMEPVLKGTDQDAKLEALETFQADVQSADNAKSRWDRAVTRSVADVDGMVQHLERWGTTRSRAMRDRVTTMSVKAADGDYEDALQDVQALSKDLPTVIKSSYEFRRKQLDKVEASAKAVGKTPDYLDTLRKTYLASAKVVDNFVSGKRFVEAVDALPQLEKDAKAAAVGAKRAVTEQQTKANCDGIRNDFNAQVKFRNPGDIRKKETNVRDAIGTPEWKAVVKKIVDTKLDDEFMAQFDESADKVADALSKNPKVKEAFVKWNAWTSDFNANKTKIQEAMQEILKVQSDELGWPTPTAEPYSKKDGDCGSYSARGYPPGTLKINFQDADSKKFKEVLDTLTHENTHAYQQKLINGFRDGSIEPGDLEYSAAMVLEMNDTDGTRGYINGKKSKKYDKSGKISAYREQPCEAHAWGAGRRVGRATFKKIKHGG